MINETARRSDFRDRIVPHLETLLQFSLWLTRDGRDAIKLMRNALTEAYRTSHDSTTDEPCDVQLHYILTRRFLNGNEESAVSLAAVYGNSADAIAGLNDQIVALAKAKARQRSWPNGESEDDVSYLAAFAGLPTAFRSVMILSYLEGFSNGEIANLAGVQPQTVEISLDRGRRFLREELFAYLMDNVNLDTVGDREVATG